MSGRIYWAITGFYLGGIYSTLGVMPRVWRWLDGVCGGNGIFLIHAVTVIMAGLLLGCMVFAKKERSVWKYFIFCALLGSLFLLGFFEENPGEKIHMPMYFALGILVFVSMKKSGYTGVFVFCLMGGGLCLAAGLVDEVIQLILSNRSFRWHDVFVNGISALIGLGVTKLIAPDSKDLQKNKSGAVR